MVPAEQQAREGVLATKLGMDMGDGKQGLRPEYIRQAVDASLHRLGIEQIDLYQAHKDDPDTPLAETLGAFGDLIAAGKVRAIGASNYKADWLRAALELHSTEGLPRYESFQPHYNLLERAEYESTLEQVVQEFRIGCIPYYSLAGGFLTGKYSSAADITGARAKTISKYAHEEGFGLVRVLDEIARQINGTPTQVALAWLMAQPSITAPIASATGPAQVDELLAASELELPASAMRMLDAVTRPTMTS